MVPPNLRREDPKVLLRFMELSASSEGIFQQELKLALGLNQSRLSKLAAKLVDAGWILNASCYPDMGMQPGTVEGELIRRLAFKEEREARLHLAEFEAT